MTEPEESAEASCPPTLRESFGLLVKAVKITVFFCLLPAVWAGWNQLTLGTTPPVLHWLLPIFVEGCSAYILILCYALDSPPSRVRACAWLLGVLNIAALLAGQLLVTEHATETPLLLLSFVCCTPVPVLIASILAFQSGAAQYWAEEAELLGKSRAAHSGFPVGRSLPGDIGPDAGNALTGTAVYRFFTVTRDLIYGGKTNNLSRRFKEHRDEKSWFRDVHHMTVVWYRDEAAALAAEEQAIKTEGPRENVTHNPRPPNNNRYGRD